MTSETTKPEASTELGGQVDSVVMRESRPQVYSCDKFELKREEGETPNGNPMNNRWVLRENEALIDFDKYRNDIAERNNLRLQDA